MAGSQWILVGSGLNTSRMVRPWGPPVRSEMAQKCHKTRIYGHKWLRWLQMAGSQWILVGSGWDTSRMVRWGHLDPPKLPLGPPGGSEKAQKCHKTGIYGHKLLRWLQMAGSQWILVGSGWDTSRMVRWGHLDPLKLPPGPPWGSEMAQKCHKTGISGHRLLRWLQMAGSQCMRSLEKREHGLVHIWCIVILARCTYSASLVNYIFCGMYVWCYASSVR